MSSLPWPACVPNGVPRGTPPPVNDSAIGQKQFATSTPLIFPARSHAKLKQLANVFIAEARQKVWRCGTLFFALVPVVYLLRNLRLRRVQRPYAVVYRHPVDDSWGLKTVARSQRLCDIAATYVAYRGSGEYRADALGLIERRDPVNAVRFVSFAFDFNLLSGRRANRGGAECKVSGAESKTFDGTLRHHLGNGEKDCPDQKRENQSIS